MVQGGARAPTGPTPRGRCRAALGAVPCTPAAPRRVARAPRRSRCRRRRRRIGSGAARPLGGDARCCGALGMVGGAARRVGVGRRPLGAGPDLCARGPAGSGLGMDAAGRGRRTRTHGRRSRDTIGCHLGLGGGDPPPGGPRCGLGVRDQVSWCRGGTGSRRPDFAGLLAWRDALRSLATAPVPWWMWRVIDDEARWLSEMLLAASVVGVRDGSVPRFPRNVRRAVYWWAARASVSASCCGRWPPTWTFVIGWSGSRAGGLGGLA